MHAQKILCYLLPATFLALVLAHPVKDAMVKRRPMCTSDDVEGCDISSIYVYKNP